MKDHGQKRNPTKLPMVPAGTGDVETFVAAIRRLTRASCIEEVMAVSTGAARHLLGADGITFVLRENELCHYADEDAISPLWKGKRFPMEACISGWCMLHKRPAAIENIYEDPRIPHDAYRPTFVRSLAMVPVERDEPIAAMGAYWARDKKISSEEVDLLQTMADAAALAIANIELRSEKRRPKAPAEEATAVRAPPCAKGNRILDTLSPESQMLLAPYLKSVELEKGMDLFRGERSAEKAYFPISGLVSLQIEPEDGSAIQTLMIGREGAVGLERLFAELRPPQVAIVQIAGSAVTVPASLLRRLTGENEEIRILLDQYKALSWQETQQLSACNVLHSAQQRLCRYLLQVSDRTDCRVLPLTQDALALVLGVQRTTVTLVAKPLQETNAIRSRRGRIEIVSRALLKQYACECWSGRFTKNAALAHE